PPSPTALGNRKRRDFHIPTAPTSLPLPNPKDQTQHTRTFRALVFRGAETKGECRSPDQRARNFQAHDALESNPEFRLILHWNQKSISGSFMDWKMLSPAPPRYAPEYRRLPPDSCQPGRGSHPDRKPRRTVPE